MERSSHPVPVGPNLPTVTGSHPCTHPHVASERPQGIMKECQLAEESLRNWVCRF